jgi:hypothetical protein
MSISTNCQHITAIYYEKAIGFLAVMFTDRPGPHQVSDPRTAGRFSVSNLRSVGRPARPEPFFSGKAQPVNMTDFWLWQVNTDRKRRRWGRDRRTGTAVAVWAPCAWAVERRERGWPDERAAHRRGTADCAASAGSAPVAQTAAVRRPGTPLQRDDRSRRTWPYKGRKNTNSTTRESDDGRGSIGRPLTINRLIS